MSARLRIAMAQINPVVGDISGNAELIKKSLHRLGLSLDDQANPPILKILNVPKKGKLFR